MQHEHVGSAQLSDQARTPHPLPVTAMTLLERGCRACLRAALSLVLTTASTRSGPQRACGSSTGSGAHSRGARASSPPPDLPLGPQDSDTPQAVRLAPYCTNSTGHRASRPSPPRHAVRAVGCLCLTGEQRPAHPRSARSSCQQPGLPQGPPRRRPWTAPRRTAGAVDASLHPDCGFPGRGGLPRCCTMA